MSKITLIILLFVTKGLCQTIGVASNLASKAGFLNNLPSNFGMNKGVSDIDSVKNLASMLAKNVGTNSNGLGSKPNLSLNMAGLPISNLSPIGFGEMVINGEVPVDGTTSVNGNVPVIGYVTFEGVIPAAGSVSVASGGCNA